CSRSSYYSNYVDAMDYW
nr:immunoglobulin heavy chain junction region [Mus musculus]